LTQLKVVQKLTFFLFYIQVILILTIVIINQQRGLNEKNN